MSDLPEPKVSGVNPGHSVNPDRWVIGVGALVGSVGGVVLLGWAIESDRLVSVVPGLESMKPTTAICLMLLGLAVARVGMHPNRPGTMALACSAVAAAIGVVTLAEYVFSWTSGLDTALFEAQVRAEGGEHPGRAAPITAFCVSVSGLSLVARAKLRTLAAHVGGLVVLAIAAVALAGYLFGAESLRRVGPYASIAVHTSVGLFLVGFALVGSTPRHGLPALARRGRGASLLVRSGLPLVVLLPALVGVVRLRGQKAGWFDTEFGVAIMVVSSASLGTAVLWLSALAVARYEDDREAALAELTRTNLGLELEVERRTLTLTAAETIQRASLDALEQGVMLFTEDYRVQLLNRAGERILGYDLDGMTQLAHSDNWITYREDGSVFPVEERPIERTLATGETISGVLMRWRTKQGSTVLLRISTRAISEHGHLTGVVVAFADVTAQRTAERARGAHIAELAALNEALEHAVAVKDQFLGTASNDMRNPINSILEFADTLARGGDQLPSQVRVKAVDAILRQARRLKALVDDLLTIAVLEAGAVEVHRTPVELEPLLTQIARDTVVGSAVVVDVPAGTVADVDQQLLTRMITNLLTNADRYGEPPITLSVDCNDGAVTISVTACGAGVPPTFAEGLSDTSSTVNRAGDPAQSDTGLGLAVAQGLATAHGGHIRYEAATPRGSRFTLELPLTATPPLAHVRSPADQAPETPDRVGRRILVIDDDADQLELLRQQLIQAGFDPMLTGDEQTALALARTNRPDLVLADLDLAGPDGFALIERLKAEPATRDTPIIVLAGQTTGAAAAQALTAGADDFLRKPIEPIELMARLRAAITTSTRAAELTHLTDSLDEASRTDTLTSLLNRRGIEGEIDRLSAFARRHGVPVSVLLADLDHFKAVNDEHGHHFGDCALRAAADAIRTSTRTEDIVGRWGGEEYVVLLPGTAASAVAIAGERIRAAVAAVELLNDAGEPVPLTISVGAASATDGDILGALPVADRRMYEAKAAGRNQVRSS